MYPIAFFAPFLASMLALTSAMREVRFTLENKIEVCDLVVITKPGDYEVKSDPHSPDTKYVEVPVETVLYGPSDLKNIKLQVVTTEPKPTLKRTLSILQAMPKPSWDHPTFNRSRWNPLNNPSDMFTTLQDYDLTPVDAAHFPDESPDRLAGRKKLIDGIVPHIRLLLQMRLKDDVLALQAELEGAKKNESENASALAATTQTK